MSFLNTEHASGHKHVYLVCFALHFLLILSICSRDTFWILAAGYTFFPHSFDRYWQEAEAIASVAVGENLAVSNPVRHGLASYMNGAGIERGYGFFAPNVPSGYKLVFEIHYGDGRVEYALPQVNGTATGLRLSSLLAEIGRTRYDALRELMLKMLAYAIWQEHPDATMIRAVFGFVRLPSASDFVQGAKASYEFLYAYDFSFRQQSAEPQTP